MHIIHLYEYHINTRLVGTLRTHFKKWRYFPLPESYCRCCWWSHDTCWCLSHLAYTYYRVIGFYIYYLYVHFVGWYIYLIPG